MSKAAFNIPCALGEHEGCWGVAWSDETWVDCACTCHEDGEQE